jgi:hypothetical protein
VGIKGREKEVDRRLRLVLLAGTTWGYAPLALSFSIGETGGAMSSSSEPDRLDSRRSDALVPSVIEELTAKGRRV